MQSQGTTGGQLVRIVADEEDQPVQDARVSWNAGTHNNRQSILRTSRPTSAVQNNSSSKWLSWSTQKRFVKYTFHVSYSLVMMCEYCQLATILLRWTSHVAAQRTVQIWKYKQVEAYHHSEHTYALIKSTQNNHKTMKHKWNDFNPRNLLLLQFCQEESETQYSPTHKHA